MTEQLLNRTRGALAFACGPSDGTVTIVDDTGWPTSTGSGNFRINVDGEIMLVTAIAGTVLTVDRGQENTTATTHPVGTPVAIVPTAAALSNYIDAYVIELQAQISLLGQNMFYPETSTYAGGADPTGVTNSQAALQACFNAAAGAGVVILTGKYLVNSQLTMKAGLHIHFMSYQAQLIKNYVATGAANTAFLCSIDGSGNLVNTNNGAKANDIKITGNGKITAQVTTNTGNIFSIYGDRFICEGFVVDTWGGGRCLFGAGDKWRSWNITMRNSDGQVGTGGWRYCGGSDSTFVGMHIESGDDALQMVPGGGNPSTSPPVALIGMNIDRCWYIGCTGVSVSGRFMAIQISNAGTLFATYGFGGLHNYVRNSGFIGCHGFGGGRGVIIYNRDSDGANNSTGYAVENIHYVDCSIDMINSTNFVYTNTTVTNGSAVVTGLLDTGNLDPGMSVSGVSIPGGTTILTVDSPDQITMTANYTGSTLSTESLTFGAYPQTISINRQSQYYASAAGIKSIKFVRFNVFNPTSTKSTFQAATTTAFGIEDILLEDCNFPVSPNSTLTVVDTSNCTNVKIRGGSIDMGNNTNLTIGGRFGIATGQNANCGIDGVRFKNVPQSINCFQFNCLTGWAERCHFEPAGGVTTAKTFQLQSNSTNITVTRNDFTALPNPTSTITNNMTTGNGLLIYDNFGDPTYIKPVSLNVLSSTNSFTPNANYQINTQVNTQSAGTLTINAPGGMAPTEAQVMDLRIKCTNAQTFSWNGVYRGSLDTPLPTTTTGSSKNDYFRFFYNNTDSVWDLVAVSAGY